MPANPKYLSSSGQRFLKLTAGILGGFVLTILFHNAIGILLAEKAWFILTSAYSSFLVWVTLLVIAFFAKSGWKIWGIYLITIGICITIIFLNQ